LSTTIKTIERRPRQPADGAAPLLLLLHGYGANERDLFDLADALDPRLHVVSARAPLALPWGGFAWYHLGGAPGRLLPDAASRDAAVATLERFVAELPGRLGADPRRVYLLGFSQGAILALALVARAPQLVAGVIAVSGYLDPELLPEQMPTFEDLPILQMHGSLDEVIPVTAALWTRDLLQATQARYTFHEYSVGHGIHPDGLQEIQGWLRARLDEPTGGVRA
jgi:phospholipase/carboxylesterase